MSGKVSLTEGTHGPPITEGLSTALSWLSILPFRGATTFDRITGTRVMASIPFVGVVFGLFTACAVVSVKLLNIDLLLAGVLIVGLWEFLNRMMHLDGLADVGDALGSYAPPERAREILADPHTGLIGFTAALFSLLVQITAVSSLLESSSSWLACLVPALCRLGGQVAARKGRKPLSPTGFGAMLIGTVSSWWIAGWWLFLTLLGIALVAFTDHAGNWAVMACIIAATGLLVCASSEALSRHFSRRFEGLNGDCIGACVHISAALSAALFAILTGALAA